MSEAKSKMSLVKPDKDRYGALYLYRDIEKATANVKGEVILSWAARLENDNYTQQVGLMHSWHKDVLGGETETYDALGVLCEIAFEAGIVKREMLLRHNLYGVYTYDGEWTLLPERIADWAGFVHQSPLVKHDDKWVTVAHLNDSPMPFGEIASLLRSTYLES